MRRLPVAMVLCDPEGGDNPIVDVNEAFERITLYPREAVIGRDCRLLQGEGTDARAVARLRAAIDARRDASVDLLNYRADGTPFTNRLRISPIGADDGGVVGFLGVLTELSAADVVEPPAPPRPAPSLVGRPIDEVMLRELQHRVKNHLAMVAMLIRE
ncbi:MAG: PAS domain-containing protein [Paracoccaceae bacterium]